MQSNNYLSDIQNYLQQEQYDQLIRLCEQQINSCPNAKLLYWYMGLALLLKGDTAEAQTTWLTAVITNETEQSENWAELVHILISEANRQAFKGNSLSSWVIRQQVREFYPNDINNLLHLVCSGIETGNYSEEVAEEFKLVDSLKHASDVDFVILEQAIAMILENVPLLPSSVELAEAALVHVTSTQEKEKFINIFQRAIVNTGLVGKYYKIGIRLAELSLSLDKNQSEILFYLANFYQLVGEAEKAIKIANEHYRSLQNTADKTYGMALLLRSYVAATNRWEESCLLKDNLESLLLELVNDKPKVGRKSTIANYNSSFLLPYFQDNPRHNRYIHNQLAQFCQRNIEDYASELINQFYYYSKYSKDSRKHHSHQKIRVGYLCHAFKSHSVGWLSRWLIKHIDQSKFDIYAYMPCCDPILDDIHQWYLDTFPVTFKSNFSWDIARRIFADEIDILIDLDSLTCDVSYEVLAVKPAPVQVTWLGWDASGLSTIDYYIADPYVLPSDAQDYYSERIWRLPQTYLAVDGFEVGVPSIRRSDLDIPMDAVIFLNAQTGSKLHRDTVHLQMQIIKAVPNSYFLIKERYDRNAISEFFAIAAQDAGLPLERLRYLPRATYEAVHRANLGIADVVLDTYPYNGATTTMETLWMCIPIVTRVGEQFAARNSYTMLVNAGISEGIAWSDQEYVEWGIRLGTDAELRKDISYRLKMSRQTAPLWNAQQFTREMEKAYQQMWQIYLDGGSGVAKQVNF